MDFISLGDINQKTIEGRLLNAALTWMSTHEFANKTPDEIIAWMYGVADKVDSANNIDPRDFYKQWEHTKDMAQVITTRRQLQKIVELSVEEAFSKRMPVPLLSQREDIDMKVRSEVQRLAKFLLDSPNATISEGSAVDVAIKLLSKPDQTDAIVGFVNYLVSRVRSSCHIGFGTNPNNIINELRLFCEANEFPIPVDMMLPDKIAMPE